MIPEIRAVYKPTRDDWYGNYPGNMVEVSLVFLNDPSDISEYKFRVCIWGNDDYGMEKDFTSYTDALSEYMFVLSMRSVEKSTLDKRHYSVA